MGLTMGQRKGVTQEVARRYRGATKARRTQILDEFVELTRYNRNYAAWILRNYGRKRVVKLSGEWVEVVVGGGRRQKVTRPRYYGEDVMRTLKVLWKTFDYMCGQRLSPMISEMLPILIGLGELHCSDEVQHKLLKVSPATIDRLLRDEKQKQRMRPQSRTKPTSILKAQIPMLTWSEMTVDEPGHVQVDLVGHDGGNAKGEYAYSLDCVDLYSGWVEPRVVMNRAQRWTVEALEEVRVTMPFVLESLHSDNGTEFINARLLGWTQLHKLQFSRSRPHRKNDNAHVEQKNYSIIRQAVGYARFDTAEELQIVRELYKHLRLLVNHFYPSAKLIEKRREGAKVYKKHDKPKSPYRRLMDSEKVPQEVKERLAKEHRRIRPMQLKQRISELQKDLYGLARRNGIWTEAEKPTPNQLEREERYG